MKIAFLSGSLSQRKDGVGDYTLRLRSQLERLGARVFAAAISDPHIDAPDDSGETLRLPRSSPLQINLEAAAARLADWQPDWISLQFVPYSYAPRGILRSALPAFRALDRVGARRHVMIHELWIGQSRNDPLKNRLVGFVQRRYIRAFLQQYRPDCIHTSNAAYIEALAANGRSAALLPLFSNIPIAFPSRDAALARALPILEAAAPGADFRRAVVAVVFGSVHPEWDPTNAVDWLAAQSRGLGKRLVVAFLGRNGEPARRWKEAFAQRADLDLADLGEQPEAEVSALLAASDIGLATTPSALLGKSGSFLGMSEHGLPTIVVREDWIPRSHAASPPAPPPPGVHLARDLPNLSLESILAGRRAPASNLESVGYQLLASLRLAASV